MIYRIFEKTVIIIQPPKCASCTIHSQLQKFALCPKFHIPLFAMQSIIYPKFSIETPKHPIVICLYRNHLERFVSLYTYICQKHGFLQKHPFKDFLFNIDRIYPHLPFMKKKENLEKEWIEVFNKNFLRWFTTDGSENFEKLHQGAHFINISTQCPINAINEILMENGVSFRLKPKVLNGSKRMKQDKDDDVLMWIEKRHAKDKFLFT